MATLTSETTFTISASPDVYVESVDLVFYPQNEGSLAYRELHYPGDVYPPIVYQDNPDRWENFDSEPWTARPQVATELTLESAQIVNWQGYVKDRSVKEIWRGAEQLSRMTGYFLRRLYEYYVNPPATDFITWWPKDRTAQGYSIVIESVQVGGQDLTTFDFIGLQADLMPLEVVLQFRIVGEVET